MDRRSMSGTTWRMSMEVVARNAPPRTPELPRIHVGPLGPPGSEFAIVRMPWGLRWIVDWASLRMAPPDSWDDVAPAVTANCLTFYVKAGREEVARIATRSFS